MTSMCPIIIIGGGVTGLSIAWQLALRNQEVFVFEKNQVGSGASNAAAGMITPASEVRFGEEGLLKLFLESLSITPSFVGELEKKSGHSTDFQTHGSLMVAIDHDDEAELDRLFDYQRELGLPVKRISALEVLDEEPQLSQNCVGGILAQGEYFLDARELVMALKKAVLAAGGKIFEGKTVTALDIKQDHVVSCQIDNETIQTERVILASGIDAKIPGLPDELILPIRPVKGQCVEVQMFPVGAAPCGRPPAWPTLAAPEATPRREPLRRGEGPPGNHGGLPLRHAVRTIHRYPVYLVPRSDGRLTIGATLEEMGHDTSVTAGALLDLIYGAWKILPMVAEMPIIGSWAGLRPASNDHKPILGPTSVAGLSVAMGMYRHGILLAPLVGKLMADWVVEGKNSKYFDTFGWKRFTNNRRASCDMRSA